MLVAEAAFATTIGGLSGILLGGGLLLIFQHSLVYYLETLHVELAGRPPLETVIVAVACAVIAASVGIIGALIPAWRAGGEQPYSLIQGESE